MDRVVYTLCALTALLCAVLLLRAYLQSRARILLWSGLCFAALTLNNVALVLDRLVFMERDLSLWRLLIGLVAMLLLVGGLILEEHK